MISGTFPIHLCFFLHSSRESSQGPCVCLGKNSVSSQCPQPGFISSCGGPFGGPGLAHHRYQTCIFYGCNRFIICIYPSFGKCVMSFVLFFHVLLLLIAIPLGLMVGCLPLPYVSFWPCIL